MGIDFEQVLPKGHEETGLSESIEDINLRRAHFITRLSDIILRRAQDEKVLVLIEDLQWADTGSFLVISRLLDSSTPNLRVIATYRTGDEADPQTHERLMRLDADVRQLPLAGLSRKELRQLVDQTLGVGVLSADEVTKLEGISSGNPMFAGELLLHLDESGLLERHSLSEAITRTRAPRRLQHAVDLRLDDLPDQVSNMLTACAVHAGEFSSDLIADVIKKPSTSVQAWLECMTDRRLVTQTDSADRRRFRFAHDIYAMRLYERTQPEVRRRFHRAFARSPECQHEPGEAARHYVLGLKSSYSRKGVKLCTVAAEEAVQMSAHESAARFWELARSCVHPSSRRPLAEICRQEGWAQWTAGKWKPASESWMRAAGILEELDELGQAGLVALSLGELYRWQQDLQESVRWLNKAVEFLGVDTKERRRALALLGNNYALLGKQDQARDQLGQAYESGDCIEPTTAFWLSYGFAAVRDSRKALMSARRGLASALQAGSAGVAALLASTLVTSELCRLRLPEAERYAEVVKHGLSPDDPRTQVLSLSCQAAVMSYVGKWVKVRSLSEKWMAAARLAGSFQVAVARLTWAEAQLAIGQPLAAQREILPALPHLARLRPIGELHLARAFDELGRQDEALSLLRRSAKRILSRSGFTSEIVLLGDVAARLDAPSLWRICHESLLKDERSIVFVQSAISVQRVLGCLSARLRLWDESSDHFVEAIESLSNGGARWELAQSILSYADMRSTRHRRGDKIKATALLLQAEDILAPLGLAHVLKGHHAPESGRNSFGLTGRELEVLALVAEGLRNREIADTLVLSPRTIERHLENCFIKMNVSGRAEAVVKATTNGLIGPLTEGLVKTGSGMMPDARLSA